MIFSNFLTFPCNSRQDQNAERSADGKDQSCHPRFVSLTGIAEDGAGANPRRQHGADEYPRSEAPAGDSEITLSLDLPGLVDPHTHKNEEVGDDDC